MEERGGRVIVGREGRLLAVDFDACDDANDDVDGGGGSSFSAIDFCALSLSLSL